MASESVQDTVEAVEQDRSMAQVEIQQDALMERLKGILEQNGLGGVRYTQFPTSFRLAFRGDYADGDRALSLLERRAEEAGYRIELMMYEMDRVPHEKHHRSLWRMLFQLGQ